MYKESLKTSDGIEIKITKKEENVGPAVEDLSGNGTKFQYRGDSLLKDVFDSLRGTWTAFFGEDEAESLLNQFVGNR